MLITTVLVDARSGSLAISNLVRLAMWNYCPDTKDRCGIARVVLPSQGEHVHQIEPSPREFYTQVHCIWRLPEHREPTSLPIINT